MNTSSQGFSLLAIFLALVTIPTALYASFTGIYPERSRGGYNYFQQYQEPADQLLMASKSPELKTVGRVQFILLMLIMVISVSNIFL